MGNAAELPPAADVGCGCAPLPSRADGSPRNRTGYTPIRSGVPPGLTTCGPSVRHSAGSRQSGSFLSGENADSRVLSRLPAPTVRSRRILRVRPSRITSVLSVRRSRSGASGPSSCGLSGPGVLPGWPCGPENHACGDGAELSVDRSASASNPSEFFVYGHSNRAGPKVVLCNTCIIAPFTRSVKSGLAEAGITVGTRPPHAAPRPSGLRS